MERSKAYGAVRGDVPHNLRQIRQARGWSLEQLAEKLGLTWQTVQKYETEPQRLRVAQLEPIAAALGCSIFDLVCEDGVSDLELEVQAAVRQLAPDDQRKALEILRVHFGPANDEAA